MYLFMASFSQLGFSAGLCFAARECNAHSTPHSSSEPTTQLNHYESSGRDSNSRSGNDVSRLCEFNSIDHSRSNSECPFSFYISLYTSYRGDFCSVGALTDHSPIIGNTTLYAILRLVLRTSFPTSLHEHNLHAHPIQSTPTPRSNRIREKGNDGNGRSNRRHVRLASPCTSARPSLPK